VALRGAGGAGAGDGDGAGAGAGDGAGAGAGCAIKGNVSSRGERIYHVPGGRYYESTEIDEGAGERFFCSEAEAVRAGWRRSQN